MVDLVVSDLDVERDGRLVLRRATARFRGGRRTVLWGRSGAGKSTLLFAIAGLVVPVAGRIALGSQTLFSSTTGDDVAPHTRKIGFVFQDLALWPHLTAREHIAIVGRLGNREVDAALDAVGLAGLAARRPGQLSGGEQQRLAIARALAGRPSILLLDEPFTSVDRTTKEALYALVTKVSPSLAGPTIYVTHQSEDARVLAESVVTVSDGRLLDDDRPWERRSDVAPSSIR